MRRMKTLIHSLIFGTLLVLVSTGCEKGYLDINDNPNSPTELSITPDLILPRALHATAERMATSYNYSALWMGYWARSGSYGPSTEEESYNITTTFQADEWSGWYNILYDLDVLELKAAESQQTFYQGMAKVLKTIGFMYLVDQYNNVPYSKAFDLGGNILPAYDKGADIYDSLIIELQAGTQLIRDAVPSENLNIETADIMFQGDAEMWRKFANTQLLKLLIRQSEVSGFDPSAGIAIINADGSGFLGSGETAYVQPGYFQDNGKQNPFWDAYKESFNGDISDNYNRANNYVLNLFRNNEDIRYQYFFSPAVSPVGGNTYYGYNYGEVVNDPDQPKAANSSMVSGPGLATSPDQAQWLFTSVESMFLQAEAIQRGWITGDAEAAYKDAVTESFVWLNVDDAENEAETYLNSGNEIVDWDMAGGNEKVELIVMQKYLALVGINNFEAWVDYRRVGVPNVPKSLAPSVGPNIPLRLRYPQNEYNYNAANVGAEGNPDVFTSGVFWDQ